MSAIAWAHKFSQSQLPEALPLRHSDGYETTIYAWSPPAGTERKLPVIQLHGIQSHPGWFGLSALAETTSGHAVYQVTRRGSGENEKDRGHADSARRLLQDVREACDFVLHRERSHQLHMVGVSWGGKLAACHCATSDRSANVATLTLIAPGIAADVDLSVFQKMIVAWSLVGNPRRLFDIPLNDVELFTDNTAMREYLRSDPLRLHRATAAFLFASRQMDWQLRRAPKGGLAMPVKLILAENDRIIDNDRTRAVLQRLSGPNLQVLELKGSHTLEFEKDPSEFLRAVSMETAAEE